MNGLIWVVDTHNLDEHRFKKINPFLRQGGSVFMPKAEESKLLNPVAINEILSLVSNPTITNRLVSLTPLICRLSISYPANPIIVFTDDANKDGLWDLAALSVIKGKIPFWVCGFDEAFGNHLRLYLSHLESLRWYYDEEVREIPKLKAVKEEILVDFDADDSMKKVMKAITEYLPSVPKTLIDVVDLADLNKEEISSVQSQFPRGGLQAIVRLAKVKKAEELLLNGDTVRTAGFASGFLSGEALWAAFRKIHGQAPTEWLKAAKLNLK